MIRIKSWGWQSAAGPTPIPLRARSAAAWALRAASLALDRLAQHIAAPIAAAHHRGDMKIEFHAESGAPEGALYVDGKLIGWLEGVRRL